MNAGTSIVTAKVGKKTLKCTVTVIGSSPAPTPTPTPTPTPSVNFTLIGHTVWVAAWRADQSDRGLLRVTMDNEHVFGGNKRLQTKKH